MHVQPGGRRRVECPIATAILVPPTGAQNSEAPQRPQNPRRTFGELAYQRNAPCGSRTVNASTGTSLDANTWPDDFRQATQ